jgi:protein-disulfide isomerase
MDKEILVIGVDPPCPRCSLILQRVQRVVQEEGLLFEIRHTAYTSDDAKKFARSMGKDIGTAKQVAEKVGVALDWNRVHSIVAKPPTRATDFQMISGIAQQWSPDLDKALEPMQEMAGKVDMLMTPVLIIEGKVRHHGSVPSVEQIRMWLKL